MLSGLHVPRSAGSRTNNFLRPLTGVGVHNGTLNIINERETRVWWGRALRAGRIRDCLPGVLWRPTENHGNPKAIMLTHRGHRGLPVSPVPSPPNKNPLWPA